MTNQISLNIPNFPQLSLEEHAANIFGKTILKEMNEEINFLSGDKNKIQSIPAFQQENQRILKEMVEKQLILINQLFELAFPHHIKTGEYYDQIKNLLPLSKNIYIHCIKKIKSTLEAISHEKRTTQVNYLNSLSISFFFKIGYLNAEEKILKKFQKTLKERLKEVTILEKFCEFTPPLQKGLMILTSQHYSFDTHLSTPKKLKNAFQQFLNESNFHSSEKINAVKEALSFFNNPIINTRPFIKPFPRTSP